MLVYCLDQCWPANSLASSNPSGLAAAGRMRRSSARNKQLFAVYATDPAAAESDPRSRRRQRREQDEHEEIELNLFIHIYRPPLGATRRSEQPRSRPNQQQQQQPEQPRYRPAGATITLRRDVGTDTRSLVKYAMDQNGQLSERISITEVANRGCSQDEDEDEATKRRGEDFLLSSGSITGEMFGESELAEARAQCPAVLVVAAGCGKEEAAQEQSQPNKDVMPTTTSRSKRQQSDGARRAFQGRLSFVRRRFNRLLHLSSASDFAGRELSSRRELQISLLGSTGRQVEPAERRTTAPSKLNKLNRQRSRRTTPATDLEAGRPFAVMISYHRAEAAHYAAKLKGALEQVGVSVYLDVDEIGSGADWQDSLNEAILLCRAFVALVTPSYGETLWTSRELKLADVLQKPIIPVNFGQRWPPASLAIQFATMQYIFWLAQDHAANPNAPPLLRPFRRAQRPAAAAATASGWPEWPAECVRLVAGQIKQSLEATSSDSRRGSPATRPAAASMRPISIISMVEHSKQPHHPLSDSGYDSSCGSPRGHLAPRVDSPKLHDDEEFADNSDDDDDDRDEEEANEDDASSLDSRASSLARSGTTGSGSNCPSSNSSDDRLESFRVSVARNRRASSAAEKTFPRSPVSMSPVSEPLRRQRQAAKQQHGLKNRAAKVFKKVRRRLGLGQQRQPAAAAAAAEPT